MSVTRKTLVAVCGGALLCCVSVFIYLSNNRDLEVKEVGETHTITLRDSGYDPEEITIKKGDAVVFASERMHDHWPASNLHPTHNIYPAFDPRRPLVFEETWTFVFDRVGSWEFHDHLNSTFTGRVIVVE